MNEPAKKAWNRGSGSGCTDQAKKPGIVVLPLRGQPRLSLEAPTRPPRPKPTQSNRGVILFSMFSKRAGRGRADGLGRGGAGRVEVVRKTTPVVCVQQVSHEVRGRALDDDDGGVRASSDGVGVVVDALLGFAEESAEVPEGYSFPGRNGLYDASFDVPRGLGRLGRQNAREGLRSLGDGGDEFLQLLEGGRLGLVVMGHSGSE
jgi:hypothetical protein